MSLPTWVAESKCVKNATSTAFVKLTRNIYLGAGGMDEVLKFDQEGRIGRVALFTLDGDELVKTASSFHEVIKREP